MTVHYGGVHRGRRLAGTYSLCGVPLFDQRSDRPKYNFTAAPHTDDRDDVTCTECLAQLEHDDRLHWCAIAHEPGTYGVAASECYEDDDGRFWITNGEYSSTVTFCPQCGAKAPKEPV